MKSGEIRSDDLAFEFAEVKVPNTAFKRVVRDLEFDFAELAIFTFLLARAHGKPLSLLPAVVTARFQHPFLVCDAERGPLLPEDLPGRRVGLALLLRHYRGVGPSRFVRRLRRRARAGELGHVRGAARRGVSRSAECRACSRR